MHARMTTIQAQADRIDDTVAQVRSSVLPVLEEQEGFRGFTVHVDRSSGKIVGTSYWESEEAMKASEEAVSGPRAQAAESSGSTGGPTVEHFEVAVDTMA
jgi:heme-degrading monooxygenase HmoA